MKVLYREELANHPSPESCGGDGNIAAEALTGESVGGTLSSEITVFFVPILCLYGEGNINHGVNASHESTLRSLSILACLEQSVQLAKVDRYRLTLSKIIRSKSDNYRLYDIQTNRIWVYTLIQILFDLWYN